MYVGARVKWSKRISGLNVYKHKVCEIHVLVIHFRIVNYLRYLIKGGKSMLNYIALAYISRLFLSRDP